MGHTGWGWAIHHRGHLVGVGKVIAQTELVEAAERSQVRAGESSVRHVEVFQVDGVGTSILGRPRPLPADRRADSYTLKCEGPEEGNRGRA